MNQSSKRTSTDKRGGQNPQWDEELRFEVKDSPYYKKLSLSVFHDDSKDMSLIGDCEINVSSAMHKGEMDRWFELSYKNKYAGEIYCEMTFYSQYRLRPENHDIETADTANGTYKKHSNRHLDDFLRPLPKIPTMQNSPIDVNTLNYIYKTNASQNVPISSIPRKPLENAPIGTTSTQAYEDTSSDSTLTQVPHEIPTRKIQKRYSFPVQQSAPLTQWKGEQFETQADPDINKITNLTRRMSIDAFYLGGNTAYSGLVPQDINDSYSQIPRRSLPKPPLCSHQRDF